MTTPNAEPAAETHINIYDRSTLIAVVSGVAREAWEAARESVRTLARDAGQARVDSNHQEWIRTPGRMSYQRAGFRAVNTFRLDRR